MSSFCHADWISIIQTDDSPVYSYIEWTVFTLMAFCFCGAVVVLLQLWVWGQSVLVSPLEVHGPTACMCHDTFGRMENTRICFFLYFTNSDGLLSKPAWCSSPLWLLISKQSRISQGHSNRSSDWSTVFDGHSDQYYLWHFMCGDHLCSSCQSNCIGLF